MTSQEPTIVDGQAAPVALTADQRKARLDTQLQRMAAGGWRIENRSDFQATIANGKKVNHLLHFFIGIITLSAWWFVWIFLGIFGGVKRRLLTVDEFGSVVNQKV